MPEISIYLASASPRRRELLRQIGVIHEVLRIAVDEAWNGVESAADYAQRLALEKALAGWQVSGQTVPVLGADTVVVQDGQVLGKPDNPAHALAMLTQLAGRTHQVITAMALVQGGRIATRLSVSEVSFAALSPADCLAYCNSGEGVDKAGGYAIQGLAAGFISHLAGSYSGVMGLPLFETAELLREFGVALFPSALTYSARDQAQGHCS